MAFKKGNKFGKGRVGPNKATAVAKEAFARFVDGNCERLQGWLDEIAKEDGPRAALDCFMQVAEFHVPKLARTEITGKEGGPVAMVQASKDDVNL